MDPTLSRTIRGRALPRAAALLLLAAASAPAVATAPPGGYVLQETLAVPSDGSAVVSTTTLRAGVGYLLRASGTITISTPPCPLADAEFARFETNDTCSLAGTPQNTVGAYDIGVGVNTPIGSNSKGITWGTTLDTSHQYTTGFAGTGGTISLNYHDVLYTDNAGTITVEIFAPLPAPIPATTPWTIALLALGLLALAALRVRRNRR